MSITQAELPIDSTLEEALRTHARSGDLPSETEAAFQEVARLMGMVSAMVKKHPEWQRQKLAERMDNILAALKRL